MIITDVKVLRANRAVYCKIYTDEGIVGLGESGAWGFLEASAQAILTMGEYLIGKDPLDIEHHWQYLYRFSHFRGAAVMGAMSAIDLALYDIAGKFFNVPVYRLLGGKCRDKVRVYNHTSGRTEEELIENAVKGVEQGYTALGHLNPYLDEPRTDPFRDGNAALLYKAERRIAKVREAVGEEVYSFSQKGGDQPYWLARAYVVLGDSFAERGQYAQAKATFESIRDGYEPESGTDDISDSVRMRLDRLSTLMQE
jgi:galactonate dehydratase